MGRSTRMSRHPHVRTPGLTVAVAGLKGGVGKTLITYHLAGAAKAAGLAEVIIVDTDPLKAALAIARKGDPQELEVLAVSALGEELPPAAQSKDLVIIDCPPSDGFVTRAAMVLADLVLLPTNPGPTDFFALGGADDEPEEMKGTVDLIRLAVKEARPDLRVAFVLNRMKPRQILSGSAPAALQAFGLPVLHTVLVERAAYELAAAAGMSVSAFSRRSSAAAEMGALFAEVQRFGATRGALTEWLPSAGRARGGAHA